MKPPKFPKLINGGSAGGESYARGLENTGAPFLTRSGFGATAQKKGDFMTEVRQGGRMIYLYSQFTWKASGEVVYIVGVRSVNFVGPLLVNSGVRQAFTINAWGWAGPGIPRIVGDGYIVSTRSSAGTVSDHNVTHWPYLGPSMFGGRENLSSETVGTRQATTFIDKIQASELSRALMNLSIFACGAVGGKNDGFTGGIGYLTATDPDSRLTSREPRIKVFNTRTKATFTAPAPRVSGRDHLPFTVFSTGRGKVSYLMGVREKVQESLVGVPSSGYTSITMEQRYGLTIVSSTNHCQSFTTANASFLTPYLYRHPASIPRADSENPGLGSATNWRNLYDRERYNDSQLEAMASQATFVYLGEGKSLLFIPNGKDTDQEDGRETGDYLSLYDGSGARVPELSESELTHKQVYFPMIFIGSGSSYTRVSWPGDDWRADRLGKRDTGMRDGVYHAELENIHSMGFAWSREIRTAQWAFGVGCMYMPVHTKGVGWRILVTRDFGSSWEFKTLPTSASGSVSDTGMAPGAVLEPYVDAENKGRIVFTGRIIGTREVEYLETDGDFTEFRLIARFKSAPVGVEFPANGSYESSQAEPITIYIGGDRGKEYVFPMFPGEFEPDE